MNRFCLLLVVLLVGGLGRGCTRAPQRIDPPSVLKTRNIPGGARISYRPPPGDSLQYVKAVYQGYNGERRVARSSPPPAGPPSVVFTLNHPTQITVGFLAYYRGPRNTFRCASVSLRKLSD